MIVLEDKSIVIITPPHTASGNLHRALCGFPHNGYWVIGPTPDDTYDHHYTKVHEGWKEFRVYIVVRNPFYRLVGLWHHDQIIWQSKSLPWPEFVEAIAHDDVLKVPAYFNRYTICRLLGSQKIDGIIRVESLEQDITTLLGEKVNISSGWGQERIHIREMYVDKSIKNFANIWAFTDCMRWNYEALL